MRISSLNSSVLAAALVKATTDRFVFHSNLQRLIFISARRIMKERAANVGENIKSVSRLLSYAENHMLIAVILRHRRTVCEPLFVLCIHTLTVRGAIGLT